ncbi:MAG TPA: hypothetical protein VF384_19290 [Planctomycetota bacterium]
MKRVLAIVGFVLALALLHFVAVVPLPYHVSLLGKALAQVSPDLLLCVGIALLGVSAGRPWLGAHLASVLLVLVITYRASEAVIDAVFQRPFELGDVQQIPGLLHLWWNGYAEATQAMFVASIALGYIVVELVFAVALRCVTRVAGRPAGACAAFAVLQLAVIGLVAASVVQLRVARPFVFADGAAETLRTVRVWLDPDSRDEPIRERILAGAERLAPDTGELLRLERADVHVLVIESYGRVAWRNPEVAPVVRTAWQQLAGDLERAGFRALVGTCAPSVRGGGSRLAHMELFTGVRVPDERTRELLLASRFMPLPAHFAAAGYHTVEAMPAMDIHWPEGDAFFGFAESLTQIEFAYRGTTYAFGQMPDQYALNVLLERCVSKATKPVFTAFVSTTSHYPWQMIPPFVDDWRIDDATFTRPPLRVHPVGQLGLEDPLIVRQYIESLDYALRAAVGFVCRLPRPSLVILLGDHQPPNARAMPPLDYSFDVPLHVFSNRPELLDPLRTLGLADGVELSEEPVAFHMAELAPALLRLYTK